MTEPTFHTELKVLQDPSGGEVRTSHLWWVEGPPGAVSLVADVVHWVDEFAAHKGPSWSPEMVELMGLHRIDGGWLMAMDLGSHFRQQQYDGQIEMDDCIFLGDGHCFYDGTSSGAQELMAAWKRSGYRTEVIEGTLRAIYIARMTEEGLDA